MNYPAIDYITLPEVTLVSAHNLNEDSNPEQIVKILIRVTQPATSILYALFNGRNGVILHDLEQDDLVFMLPELDAELTSEEQQLAIDEMGAVYEEVFTTYNYLLDLGIPIEQAELVLPNGLTVPLHMSIPILEFKKFVEMDLPFWNRELKHVCNQFKFVYMQLFAKEIM